MPPPTIGEEPEDEGWLMTYADAITLLMAFFVMLVSFSKIDLPTFDQVMAGIKDEIGMGQGERQLTGDQIAAELENAVFEMAVEQSVSVQSDERGIIIEMASGAFYKPGTADLKAEAIPILGRLSDIFTKEAYKYFFVDIAGHTDDDPISTPRYPSNWELSSGRSAAVVRVFSEKGIHPHRLKAIGRADTEPLFANRDEANNPIPANQARNRRVVITMTRMLGLQKKTFEAILLDERLREEEHKRREAEEARAREEGVGEFAPDTTAPQQ